MPIPLVLALLAATTDLVGPPVPPDPCELVARIVGDQPTDAEPRAELGWLGIEGAAEVALSLAGSHPGPRTLALVELLGEIGSSRDADALRPLLFSEDVDLAAAATWAFAETAHRSAAPTLEYLLRAGRPFAQTLLAIETLGELELSSSFATLSHLAEDPSQDPVLRATAARALPGVDRPRTRKWLSRLKLPAETSPLFRAEVERLLAEGRIGRD